jgi:hypothetical protein
MIEDQKTKKLDKKRKWWFKSYIGYL